MPKTTNFIDLLNILQLLIDAANEKKIGESDSSINKTRILSAFFTLNKTSTRLSYLISGTKKAFSFLYHAFI